MDYERTSWAKRRSEQRKRDAALRYELEMESRKMNGVPAVVYDEQKNLFPFRDGRFASREHADWALCYGSGAR